MGVADSQLPPAVVDTDAVKACADPSLAVTFTFCEFPVDELKLSVFGDTESVGIGGGELVPTLNVTLTVCGLLLAPEAVTVTVPMYAPAARPVGSAVTVTPIGVLPPGGVADNQLPPDTVETPVVNARDAPLLVTWKLCVARGVPLKLKVNAAGLTVIEPGGGVAAEVSV